jgi:hypothetical protein
LTIRFLGGPYDGLRLDDYQVISLATVVPLRTAGGLRVYALMPPLADWPAVLAGDPDRTDGRPDYAYELVRTPGGLALRDAERDGGFDRAVRWLWGGG